MHVGCVKCGTVGMTKEIIKQKNDFFLDKSVITSCDITIDRYVCSSELGCIRKQTVSNLILY